jgi:hypothetical protein
MADVIYQVNLKVSDYLISDFEKYMLEEHIPDVLKTGKFHRCVFARREKGNYQIEYFTNREALNNYLETESKKLRQDFIERFPDGIEISRNELEILQIW